MPRLVNYTPQATVVRLLTINAVNGYLTSWALYLIGGAEDPRLLLPAWIGISTVCLPRPTLLAALDFPRSALLPLISPSPLHVKADMAW